MDKLNKNEIPESPGVYIFKDKYDEPIYIGKAKNLRNRVVTYFNSNSNWKVKRLVSEAKNISFVLSKNEANALLAEYSLIQEYKPKYNIQFKDDKSYPYVTITNDKWQRVYVSRNIDKKNLNFGPFPYIGAAKRSLDHLINIFPLRTCNDNTFNRHNSLGKPCLLYEIEKCSAPCINNIDEKDYQQLVNSIKNFYKGNSDQFITEKIIEMNNYSEQQEYEKANKIKKLVQHLENARINQTLMTANDKNVDVIGIDIGKYDVVATCLFIRNGRIVGEIKKSFEPINTDEFNDYLPQIIFNIYSNEEPASELLVSHSFNDKEDVEKELSQIWKRKINIQIPQRGWKRDLLLTALEDAAELRRVTDLKRRKDLEFRSQSLEQLKNKLNLKNIPYRIEAYDISNLGDKFRVGSMVVMEDGLTKPSMYRKFHIRSFEGQDDFRSMEEMIFRRIKRLISTNETDQSFKRLPDLILIDGGKGQLSKAKSVIDYFKLEIDVIGLAKKEEELFLPNRKESIKLNKNSEALFILQNIRDEAHRFAITENRRLRLKDLDINSSLKIKGVSKKSLKELNKKYNSLVGLSNATLEDLAELLDENEVKKVFKYFN